MHKKLFLISTTATAILLASCGTAQGSVNPHVSPLPDQRTRPITENTKDLIVRVAQQHAIDPVAFLRMAEIESGFNPNAFNSNSEAAGIFQFIPSTARAYGLKNPFDAEANAHAAAKLWKDNANVLSDRLHRTPTAGELYLAHQQGALSAAKLLANPDKNARDIVGLQAVIQNGGDASMTALQFARLWTNRFE